MQYKLVNLLVNMYAQVEELEQQVRNMQYDLLNPLVNMYAPGE